MEKQKASRKKARRNLAFKNLRLFERSSYHVSLKKEYDQHVRRVEDVKEPLVDRCFAAFFAVVEKDKKDRNEHDTDLKELLHCSVL